MTKKGFIVLAVLIVFAAVAIAVTVTNLNHDGPSPEDVRGTYVVKTYTQAVDRNGEISWQSMGDGDYDNERLVIESVADNCFEGYVCFTDMPDLKCPFAGTIGDDGALSYKSQYEYPAGVPTTDICHGSIKGDVIQLFGSSVCEKERWAAAFQFTFVKEGAEADAPVFEAGFEEGCSMELIKCFGGYGGEAGEFDMDGSLVFGEFRGGIQVLDYVLEGNSGAHTAKALIVGPGNGIYDYVVPVSSDHNYNILTKHDGWCELSYTYIEDGYDTQGRLIYVAGGQPANYPADPVLAPATYKGVCHQMNDKGETLSLDMEFELWTVAYNIIAMKTGGATGYGIMTEAGNGYLCVFCMDNVPLIGLGGMYEGIMSKDLSQMTLTSCTFEDGSNNSSYTVLKKA